MVDALVIALHDIALLAGFWGIVLFAFAQEVFPPIPSTVFAITLGFALYAGAPFSIGTIASMIVSVGIPLALGLTVGAVVIYYVFYWGGRPLLDRYGHLIGVSWNDIEKLNERFHGTRWDEYALFLVRAFPLMPSVLINVFAGITRWPIKSFIVLAFTGTVVRGFLGAFIGWQAGSAFMRYAQVFEQVSTWVGIMMIVALVGFVLYRLRNKRTTNNQQPTTRDFL